MTNPTGPLKGLRVFDLTRILAGPTCTQLLGDLGAEVIKVERPGAGDDTRKWGPPYVKDAGGGDTSESAYYLSSNRNKRSVAIDIAKPAGQRLARRLIAASDVMVENFKVGDMARYGLSHDDIKGGMYATVAILAALHHRDRSGEGQYIDLGLLDTQVAWLANIGLNYLTG